MEDAVGGGEEEEGVLFMGVGVVRSVWVVLVDEGGKEG